jgi:hypothetical protein
MRESPATPIYARARDNPAPEPSPQPDDVFVAIERLFSRAFARLDKVTTRQDIIEQRLDALEARLAQPPAARVVRHVRNSGGAIVRSILVSDGQ